MILRLSSIEDLSNSEDEAFDLDEKVEAERVNTGDVFGLFMMQ